jgi:hypothetical protein
MLLPRAAVAQVTVDPNATPVAVISLVWGVVTVKHSNEDYKPARWLEPIFPGDFVKTVGPGSKLLITYFFDNHQEVMGQDSEAMVDKNGLASKSGPAIRKDRARNPFGVGGVQSPFVYTHRLVTPDFKKADDAGQLQAENGYLPTHVDSGSALRFAWPAVKGVKQYTFAISDATGNTVATMSSKTATCKVPPAKAGRMFFGTVYRWSVRTPDGRVVIPPTPFLYLSRPLEKWLAESRAKFDSLRKRKQLQRSDYTDFLLVCAQLVRVDDCIALTREIAAMDGKNPQAFRALTRALLAAGCPAHAKQAHDKEIELGGFDPVFP